MPPADLSGRGHKNKVILNRNYETYKRILQSTFSDHSNGRNATITYNNHEKSINIFLLLETAEDGLAGLQSKFQNARVNQGYPRLTKCGQQKDFVNPEPELVCNTAKYVRNFDNTLRMDIFL